MGSKLRDTYYPSTTSVGSVTLLIGSHGKRTRVRPPRDVDIAFLMPISQFNRYDDYSGNGQSQLLQDLRNVLLQRFPTTAISGNGQVVQVKFVSGHSVEVVPVWAINSRYLVPDTHSGGSWKTSDYAAEQQNVADSDRATNGNTRKLIKMMKVWQQHRSVPIKSLVLELRAVNFLARWEYAPNSSVYHDWMVRDFFAELIKNANNYCTIPGIDEKCQYGDEWLSKARTALAAATRACEHEGESLNYLAAEEWQSIFGSLYPDGGA